MLPTRQRTFYRGLIRDPNPIQRTHHWYIIHEQTCEGNPLYGQSGRERFWLHQDPLW